VVVPDAVAKEFGEPLPSWAKPAQADPMGVRLTGTLGILLRAKREGRLASMRAALEVLERTGFHMSSDLRAKACQLAGE